MRSKVAMVIVAILTLAGAFWIGRWTAHHHAAGAADAPAAKPMYTCGMHPQVIQDTPGNCPICGMKLTLMTRSTPGAASSDRATILIDPVTIQNMGIRTGVVSNGPVRRVIRTVGTIDYNEPALAEVTTKFKGWVEKLFVDATGKQVHKGEPLFAIYSPELYSAQTEYLLTLNSAPATDADGRKALLDSARLKLRFFDISDEQIAQLEQSRQPSKTLRITAPQDGFVITKMVVEGQMVEAGMTIYRLADLGLVWVYAEVYEQDLPFIQLGQEALVSLSYLPDRQFRGRVTYIYPTVDEKTRTARLRMEFHNPGYLLKPGMFANVELRAELHSSALLVPDMAVLRSGEKNTVFVALEGGRFEPRLLTLGPRTEHNQVQVLSGLSEGERVVVSGQFMLDSESQMREAIQKMLEPGSPAPRPANPDATQPAAETGPDSAAQPEPHAYVCPMPEHVSIEYQHPGQCPLCGMALVPVSAATLAKMQPGGTVEYYTCPMPEHSAVRLEKSGKCPKCAMTLIPVMFMLKPVAAPAAREADPSAAPLPILYTCPMASHAHVVLDQPGKCPECEMTLVETGTVRHGAKSEALWRARSSAGSSPSP